MVGIPLIDNLGKYLEILSFQAKPNTGAHNYILEQMQVSWKAGKPTNYLKQGESH